MQTHETLAEFIRREGGLSRFDFESRFPHPFLLLEFSLDDHQAARLQPHGATSSARDATEWKQLHQEEKLNALVAPLMKSDRNRFREMITVGRAPNNDVVVGHPSVSKFHACFRRDPEGDAWTVEDAGSTYGTTLEARLLRKNKPEIVRSGNAIVLAGSAIATFLTGADFFDYTSILGKLE